MCYSHVLDEIIGPVLRVGDAGQSSETFMFKCRYPAFCVRVRGRDFSAVRLGGDFQGRVEPLLGG
ncbi:hypothetical protein DPMN_133362 [Dreissena polymorpha]|uniref:Uncharacterized protein n=1 Tax=Dreissena polymorpha TaxID=45954 RepID=A0A9D4FY93_DREPO|nr:hypothetical protein DPMN_133362 [Dreissena polymorpha]